MRPTRGEKRPPPGVSGEGAKKQFHDTAKRQKKCQWDDFLKNADGIWKAAKYLQPDETGGFHKISGLKAQGRLVEDDKDVGQVPFQEVFDGNGPGTKWRHQCARTSTDATPVAATDRERSEGSHPPSTAVQGARNRRDTSDRLEGTVAHRGEMDLSPVRCVTES